MATDDAVTTITEALKETDELPRKQIAEIVEVLGPDVALSLLDETKRVQNQGGIEVRDGTRRRTDGGVFFSLAKGRLPKSDRNRIFRVRPPKAPNEGPSENAQQTLPLAEAPRGPVVRPVQQEERPRPAPPPPKQIPAAGPLGRRRVVEVEVLRTHTRPALDRAPEVRAPAPQQTATAREERNAERETEPHQELRPVRRIVTVAPVVREEPPPSTPEAAAEKLRATIKGLKLADQRRVVGDLLREIGGWPELPKPKPEPKRVEPPPPPPRPQGLDASTKERVLAAVTDALGLSSGDLAEVLYGDDSPSLRAKARTALERFRRG
ncbi:MAG TPA: phosphorylated adapter RNA export RNA-binding domain-containing protein [Polyangiaceae bacterium]|nr:phosphorylated adapter RNA export RNA-binding domain-containing protein [Polyangiaceae bacterium]